MHRMIPFAVAASMALALPAEAQTREDKVRNDRKKVESEGFWIYHDLAKGLAEAKAENKPLFVILRCIPCEECVKLDDDLVNQDPRVRPLLEKFVRVRIIGANGLDLSVFQFDYDQSFAGFFLNADGAIYGRYGTRSHRKAWSDDVSIEGLARALEGALQLHAQYPKNKDALAGNKGPAPEAATPERLPMLKDKYKPTLDFAGKVVPSCIHCHQIGDAQRQVYRARNEPVPEQVLFGYPHPKALGLILDPKQRATVLRVEKDSLAAKAGFQPDDRMLTLEGRPLLSIADVQWALQQADPNGATLKAIVMRDREQAQVTLELPKGWRRADDISWRASTWGLRRMATGGMLLETYSAAERQKAGLPESGMALRVKHVGQFGPHAAAMNAGVRVGDTVIAFDGRTDLLRETDLIRHAIATHRPGETVALTIVRDGKRLELKLPMQP